MRKKSCLRWSSLLGLLALLILCIATISVVYFQARARAFPAVAPHQVVIIPIPRGNWKETVLPTCEAIRDQLTAAGVRVKLDATEENSPGWKYAEWELRGVPLRLEVGPKDIEKGAVFSARRDTREKASIPMAELTTRVPEILQAIQDNLLARALAFREEHTSSADTWAEFTAAMEGRPGFVIASSCGSAECEAAIKTETQAILRNIPMHSPRVEGTCIKCNAPSHVKAWFAKAY